MKNFIKVLACSSFGLLVAGVAHAAPCDGSNACNPPGTTSLAAPNITVAQERGLQVRNTSAGTANVSGTVYWFYATTDASPNTNSGDADFDNNDTTGNRRRSGSPVPDSNGVTAPSDLLTNGRITELRADTNYDIYSQACRPGSNNDVSANLCSDWVKVYDNVRTLPLPTNVFITPVKTDVTSSLLTIRINGTKVDPTDPFNTRITFNNVDAGTTDPALYPITYANPFTVSQVTTPPYSFVPNTAYRYTGQVEYPYSLFTTAELKGPFYTDPVRPGTPAATPTHFTASVTFDNAAGSIGNPAGTTYQVTATAPGTTGTATVDSTTGSPGVSGDPNEHLTVRLTNLVENTLYTLTVTALNNNASWNNSPPSTSVTFRTLAIDPTFSFSNVGENSATLSVRLATPAGITDYSMDICPKSPATGGCIPVVSTANWTGAPNVDVSQPATSLRANTPYSFHARFFEDIGGTLYRSGSTPATDGVTNSFTTDAAAVTAGAVTAPGAHTLHATWTDSLNPEYAGFNEYRVRYCTVDNVNSGSCNAQDVNKGGSNSIAVDLTTNVDAETPYYVFVMALNRTGSPWESSAWVRLGSATTRAEDPVVISPAAASLTTGSNNTQTFTATVRDEFGSVIVGATVTWTITGSGNGTLSVTNGSSTLFTATQSGSVTLRGTRNGLSGTAAITISNSGATFTSGPTLVVNADNKTGSLSATANDNDAGVTTLTYTCSTKSGPADIVFEHPTMTAPKNTPVSTNVSFTKAGTYIARCDVGGAATDSNQGVVQAILSQITVAPNDITVDVLKDQVFEATARDQFGDPMSANYDWSTTGGAVSGSGVFRSASVGRRIRVTATSGSLSGSAFVSVVNFDVSNAIAYPVPWKSSMGRSTITFKNLGSEAEIRIFSVAGRKVWSLKTTNETEDWNIKNLDGEDVVSGVYFYTVESPKSKKDGKIIIIR